MVLKAILIKKITNFSGQISFNKKYPKNFYKTSMRNVEYYLIDSKPSNKEMPGGNNLTWDWSKFININKKPRNVRTQCFRFSRATNPS